MNSNRLIRQTLFLSCSHFAVRILGFLMRIWLSRELGVQAMGLVELTHSAQMLLITPVVSGLPTAITRMCAKTNNSAHHARIVRCGMALALATGLPLAAAAFCFREPFALWLGDIRTMPALLIYLPCVPVLGVSCVLNGYFYGTNRPVPPALSEILEQAVRFLLSIRLVHLLQNWPITLRAAIPAAAALAGETLGLAMLLVLALGMLLGRSVGIRRDILKEMLALSLPLTGMRIVSALMRTVNSTLIPVRLQVSGLASGEALGRLGMMQGMLIPLLLLPSFITCSLCTVCSPELTRRQTDGRPMGRLVGRMLASSLGVGVIAMTALYILAPLFANTLYRQAELLPLIRRCCALVPILSLTQVLSGIMNGLGLQSTALRISLTANLVCVVLTYILTAIPSLRLGGALIAMAAAQFFTLTQSLQTILRAADRSV